MKQITPIAFICAVIGLMAWCVQDWSAPHKPLLMMLGLLTLFFVARYTVQIFQGETDTKALLPGVPEIITAVATLGIAAMWFVVPVRKIAVPFASIQSRLNVEKALGDPAKGVQVKACVQLFKINVGKSANRLITHLENHPSVAEQCLHEVKVKKIADTGFIARKLVASWNLKLMTQILNSRPPIESFVVPFYNLANDHTEIPAKAHVLACATSSVNPKARVACADFMGKKGNLALAMGKVEEFPAFMTKDIYPMLSALTFKEKMLDAENKEVARKLTVASPATKRWVGELGCYLATSGGPEAVDGVRGLVSFVEGGPCRPKDNEARLLFSKADTWTYACEVAETFPKEAPIEKALCEGINRSLVAVAVEEAKRRVMANARSWYLLAIAMASKENMSMYNGQMTFQARMKMWQKIANGGLFFSDMTPEEISAAYGFNGGADRPIMGMLNAIPGASDFLKDNPEIQKELKKNLDFDLNSQSDRDALLYKAFAIINDGGKGKDITNHVFSIKKFKEIRSKKNTDGRAKATDAYRNARGDLSSKSSGVKSRSVKSRSVRSRTRSRGSRRGGITITN